MRRGHHDPHGALVRRAGAAVCPAGGTGAHRRAPHFVPARPEDKTGKNRVHWDINLAGADKDEVRAGLEARGAVHLWTASQGPYAWHTMADPEGNEFCIS
ncbi:VOC family protein [Arthrobacter sp. A5]|uniref:VOC family protein n=1 Tax=Arthrobacter sp. A5 TaxID=576926 RepID=UPI003DA7C03D